MEPIWRHAEYFPNCIAKGFGYVPGELRIRHSGTPIYAPTSGTIIESGTSHFSADCDFQREVMGWEKFDASFKNKNWDNKEFQNTANMVKGQWIMCEDEDDKRFKSLDDLEEFFPDQPESSLYDRFLIQSPALIGPVWIYGVPKHLSSLDYREAKNKYFYDMKIECPERDPDSGAWLSKS